MHSQWVVTTRDPRRADRDTHLGGPDLPSGSEGNRAPHTQLQQEHLHSWIRLRDPPAGQRSFPDTPIQPAHLHLLGAHMGAAKPQHHLLPHAPCQHLLPSSDPDYSSAPTLSGLTGEAMTYESSHPSPKNLCLLSPYSSARSTWSLQLRTVPGPGSRLHTCPISCLHTLSLVPSSPCSSPLCSALHLSS